MADNDSGDAAARRKPLRWLCDSAAFYAVLALLAAAFLGWSLIAVVLAPILPRAFGRLLGQAVIRIGFRGFLDVLRWTGIVEADLAALDRLRAERGVVYAANHPALLDIFLLAARLPNTVCIVKASLFHNPMLGGAKLAGYLRNDAPLPLIRRAAAALREGSNLLIFPEGTRSRDGAIGPFKPGFALIARAAAAPVQAILIESNTPYLRKGWPLWRRPDFPLRYRIRLGPRLPVTGRAEAFSAALRAQMAAPPPERTR